jgi:UDP-N-acetylmuramoyl-L-alanine---L-glutamate ligase
MIDKHKTLGIIGFGKEGQAIFQYYKDKFGQVYIFDEKLNNLSEIIQTIEPVKGEYSQYLDTDKTKKSKNVDAINPPFEGRQAKPGGAINVVENVESKNFTSSAAEMRNDGVAHVNICSNLETQNGDIESTSTYSAKCNHGGKIIKLFNNFQIPTKVDFLVKSPGIAVSRVKLQNPDLQINSLISLLFQKLDMSKVIAITGTKGKSTVSSLVYHILKSNGYKVELLGNIGNINMSLLDDFDPDCYYVFELSSFQCQQLTVSPHIAIWTNFFIDHQDVHADMAEYFEAKRNITKFQTSYNYFITSLELSNTETLATKIVVSKPSKFTTKLLGQHNQINCQLAFEACAKLGLDTTKILESIKTFEPIKGRLEKVGETNKNGKLIEFYTDDLATIPEATWQAILAFDGKVKTLITGGSIKGSDYAELSQNLAKTNIQNIIYFNPTGKEIVSKVDPSKVALREAKSMKEAVQFVFELTEEGVCLLSCASASFGLFQNAYDRGEQYRHAIAINNTHLTEQKK